MLRARSAGLFVALALLTVPAVVVANHQFPDVPNGHPFHEEISFMAEAGITAGFMDGGYHPSDSVTRQAMAAFLKRGLGHVMLDNETTLPSSNVHAPMGTTSTAPVVVREIDVDVPGATNFYSPTQLGLAPRTSNSLSVS